MTGTLQGGVQRWRVVLVRRGDHHSQGVPAPSAGREGLVSCFPRSAGERPAASSPAGRFDDSAVDQEVFLVKADQPVPVPSWHSSTTEEAAQALADQANTGTFLVGFGLTVVPAGPNRLAIQAEHEPARVLPTAVPPRPPRDLIEHAKRDGYVLTYASCGLGRSITELRRVLKDGTVTVRFVAEPDSGRGTYFNFNAQVVTGSTEFGPRQGWTRSPTRVRTAMPPPRDAPRPGGRGSVPRGYSVGCREPPVAK